MEKFIRDYLDTYFYVDKSDIGNYGIYYKNDTRRYKAPFSGKKILTEICTVFSLDEESLKTIINDWANVDLDFYWTDISEIFTDIPNILVSLQNFNLVTVEPMSGPTGQLMYLDYIYEDKKKNKFVKFFSNIYIKIKNFINKLWKKLN